MEKLFNKNEWYILDNLLDKEIDYMSCYSDIESKQDLKELKELRKKIKKNSNCRKEVV